MIDLGVSICPLDENADKIIQSAVPHATQKLIFEAMEKSFNKIVCIGVSMVVAPSKVRPCLSYFQPVILEV